MSARSSSKTEPETGADESTRHPGEEPPPGPLESLFQEAVRRATGLGLSSFFTTEEAVRRAVADNLPDEWARYLSEQGDDLRGRLVDRLTAEFGDWLRGVDLEALMRQLLDDYEIKISFSLEADPKPPSAQLVRKR